MRSLGVLAFGAIVYMLLTQRTSSGQHAHRCPCGNVWVHSDVLRGNKEAHRCSACGEMLPGGWNAYPV